MALSLNIEYRDEYDKEDIEDMVVRWAKVSNFYDMQVGRVRILDLLSISAFPKFYEILRPQLVVCRRFINGMHPDN